jgi:DNA-binding HxlR family transcriptional regulator
MEQEPEYTREEVLESITEIGTADSPPTQIEYELHDDTPSLSPVLTHFASWVAARNEAYGIDPDPDTETEPEPVRSHHR